MASSKPVSSMATPLILELGALPPLQTTSCLVPSLSVALLAPPAAGLLPTLRPTPTSCCCVQGSTQSTPWWQRAWLAQPLWTRLTISAGCASQTHVHCSTLCASPAVVSGTSCPGGGRGERASCASSLGHRLPACPLCMPPALRIRSCCQHVKMVGLTPLPCSCTAQARLWCPRPRPPHGPRPPLA